MLYRVRFTPHQDGVTPVLDLDDFDPFENSFQANDFARKCAQNLAANGPEGWHINVRNTASGNLWVAFHRGSSVGCFDVIGEAEEHDISPRYTDVNRFLDRAVKDSDIEF